MAFRKIEENEVADKKNGTRCVIENGSSITYMKGKDKVYIMREPIWLPSGDSDGNAIDLTCEYEWESGKKVTPAELQQIRDDLTEMAKLLDTRFVITI